MHINKFISKPPFSLSLSLSLPQIHRFTSTSNGGLHLRPAQISAHMASPPLLPRLPLSPQTLSLHPQMGLRQFPPPGQEPQEVRLMGGNHGPHRRHRQILRLPAGAEGPQLGSSWAEPQQAGGGLDRHQIQIRVDPDQDGGGGLLRRLGRRRFED